MKWNAEEVVYRFDKAVDWYLDRVPEILWDAVCAIAWWLTIAPLFGVGWVCGKLYSGFWGGWNMARTSDNG